MAKPEKLSKAKKGDEVFLGVSEYDIVNDGGSIRIMEVVKYQKVLSREKVMKRKAELLLEVESLDEILAQMDDLGVV